MQKVGRNDPCPCGSGKKFKKCCELKDQKKKFKAELISAQQPSKVSSLFFKKNPSPIPSEEPPNPVM